MQTIAGPIKRLLISDFTELDVFNSGAANVHAKRVPEIDTHHYHHCQWRPCSFLATFPPKFVAVRSPPKHLERWGRCRQSFANIPPRALNINILVWNQWKPFSAGCGGRGGRGGGGQCAKRRHSNREATNTASRGGGCDAKLRVFWGYSCSVREPQKHGGIVTEGTHCNSEAGKGKNQPHLMDCTSVF